MPIVTPEELFSGSKQAKKSGIVTPEELFKPIQSRAEQPIPKKKDSTFTKIARFDPVGDFIKGTGKMIVDTFNEKSDLAPSKTDYAGGSLNPLNLLGKVANTKVFQGISNLGKEGAIPGLSALNIAAPAVKTLNTIKKPILALPAPRMRGNVNTAVTDDIIRAQETGPRGLPEPSISAPTTARTARNPYRVKYEELLKQANQRKFTPGREVEELEEMWTHMASKEDPNLDKLIDLAYPKKRIEVNADLPSKAKTLQRQREVYGVPNKAKDISDRYNQNIGKSAAPVERVEFIRQASNALEGKNIKTSFKNAEPTKKDIVHEVKATAKKISFDESLDMKDLSGFNAQTRDVYRNLEATLGVDKAKPYIENLNAAKSENVDMQEYWTKQLKTEVVDKLGIRKGTKLSGLVQKFGEKQIDLNQLKTQAPDEWEKVVEADQWFRQSYDHLIDIVNDSRQRIYPNNPDKLVPKRSDYYRHFRDLQGLAGLKNLFETPAQISPGLSGISEFVKPKSKFAGFMQKRGLGPFKNDAVGGFLEYIPSASYSTHIDPQIGVFRGLAKELAEVTDETKTVNNLIEYLQDYSNALSGKTNPMDRFVQKIIGRKTMGVVRWINNRVKSNTILGNVGSLFAQLGNIPNGLGEVKLHAIEGMSKTLASVINRDQAFVKQSPFLKERYFNTREFDTRWIDQPRKLASWAIETADRVGTEFIWNSLVSKGVKNKVPDPIAYADDMTRKLVAGRGVGEQPLIQSSAVYQVLAPFTLEVANAWRVMGDFVAKKDAGAIITLFLASYMFNKVAEEVRGSGVVFDPIQAMYEGSQPGLTPLERVGRVAGEVISNVPFGQQIASAYPEYGTGKLPTREKLFGDNDPTRFGSGLAAVKGFEDPARYLLLPFGGNQVNKTAKGILALGRGVDEKNGKMKFPIDKNPIESAKAVAFGPSATKSGREYYDLERRPLSEEQTEAYKSLPDDQKTEAYKQLMLQRLEDSAQRATNDEKLSEKEKKKKIAELQRKYSEVMNQK